jgi:hypothetical protein
MRRDETTTIGQGKTRQDTTRHDKTRQDKIRQDKIRQDKIRQRRTQQGNAIKEGNAIQLQLQHHIERTVKVFKRRDGQGKDRHTYIALSTQSYCRAWTYGKRYCVFELTMAVKRTKGAKNTNNTKRIRLQWHHLFLRLVTIRRKLLDFYPTPKEHDFNQ